MKRSNEPVFWALFGGGGVLSALIGPVLVLMTGVLVPLGLLLPEETMSYANVLVFIRNPFGQIALLTVISLFLFHGCHRMLHSLHDLGFHTGARATFGFYGFAAAGTVITVALILWIGF
jgi:fumarate reductase subunit D